MKILDKLPKIPKSRTTQVKSMFAVISASALGVLFIKGIIWFWNVIPY